MEGLPSAINNGEMISVNVDNSNFIQVLKKMNAKMKEQDQKIKYLEEALADCIPKKRFEDETLKTSQIVKDAMEKVGSSVKDVASLKIIVDQNHAKVNEEMENKFNEVVFATSITTKSAIDSMDSKLSVMELSVKETEKVLSENKSAIVSIRESVAEDSNYMHNLNDRVEQIHEEFLQSKQSQSHSSLSTERKEPGSSISNFGSDEIQNLGNRVTKMEQRLQFALDMDAEAQKRSDKVYDSITKMVNDKLAQLQQSIKKSFETQPMTSNVSGSNPSSSQLNELWAISNQNRAAILNNLTEHNIVARKVEVLAQAIEYMQKVPTAEEMSPPQVVRPIYNFPPAEPDPNRDPLDKSIKSKEHVQLASTIDGLGDRMNVAMQDIVKIKSAVNRNEKGVRDVVLAIIDEFKLIRGNASGLENLPPLNLATCVPSFFNNPSFTFARGESSCSSTCESERSVSVSRSNDHLTSITSSTARSSDQSSMIVVEDRRRRTKVVSGLLHLVCRPDFRKERSEVNKLETDEEEDIDMEMTRPDIETDFESDSDFEEDENDDDMTNNRTKIPLPVQMLYREGKSHRSERISPHRTQDDDREAYGDIDPESLAEMREMFTKFSQDKDRIISVMDRKVDRDMVERLFNKFRSLLQGMNERLKELATMNKQFATRKDMEVIAKFLTHSDDSNSASAGVKKGTECLFCGKARSSIAGQASPRQMSSGVTISGVDQGFVYGDGGAFRSSLVENKVLPPLGSLGTRQIAIAAA